MRWLLLLVPASLVLAATPSPPTLTFCIAIAAVVPLADWIRRATEQIALRAGPAVGGLVNVSFGNAPEFVLALFVLASGRADVVKAQLTGAIIGNGLLGLGIAILAGGVGREKQTFNRANAGRLSSLLVLSTIALLLPALFDRAVRANRVAGSRWLDEHLSIGVSIVLMCVYAANLMYTLVTHRDAFASAHDHHQGAARASAWPVWRALVVLGAATAAIAVEAELISSALSAAAASMHVSELFLGAVLLAVAGNAAEYISAAYFARRDRIGLAVSITVGSTIQIALLVAPLLVAVSAVTRRPLDLVFSSPLELVSIAAVAFGVNAIAHDGETTWFEGVLLLAIYALLALAFYFV